MKLWMIARIAALSLLVSAGLLAHSCGHAEPVSPFVIDGDGSADAVVSFAEDGGDADGGIPLDAGDPGDDAGVDHPADDAGSAAGIDAGPPEVDGGPALSWTWFDDFTKPPGTPTYVVDGNCTSWNGATDVYLLTTATTWCRSRLFRAEPISGSVIEVSARIHAGQAAGADGVTIAFVKDPNYPRTGTPCSPANCGGYLDFEGATGFAAEFDTYGQNTWDPVNAAHVAVVSNGVQQHLAWALSTIDDGQWHTVVARFDHGAVEIRIDGAVVVALAAGTLPPTFVGHVGLTSGTGADATAHQVEWWSVTVWP